MALQKQNLEVNFGQGLDTKTDKFQVSPGRFLDLENSIFDTTGQLTKRNGFGALTALPNTTSKFITTFNGSLTAVGSSLTAYSEANQSWVTKGSLQPVEVSTLPLIRSNLNQSQADSVVAPNGLVCTVYTDNPSTGVVYKYVVADSITGQNIVAPTVITPASGTQNVSARVFLMSNYFIVMFGTSTNHIQYIAIPLVNPTSPTTAADITSSYASSTTLSYDAFVASNGRLYVAFNSTSGGQSVKVTYLAPTLGTPPSPVVYSSQIGTFMSVTADVSAPATPIIYVSYYDAAGSTGYTIAVDQNLNKVISSPAQIISTGSIANITSTAISGVCSIFFEVTTAYSYGATLPTNILKSLTVAQSGTVTTLNGTVFARSVGLASKAFLIGTSSYMLSVYSSTFQPTYFLLNTSGQVVAALAYENGSGYYTVGLPSVTVTGSIAQFAYFYKDLIQATNKTQGNSAALAAPVYSQLGINLGSIKFGTSKVSSAEIGSNLNLSGGFLWMYDGYSPTEQNFFLFPDNVVVTTATGSGAVSAQPYYYVATYEWADNQGNVFRSAPSIPVAITTTTASSTNTINVPTLRLTYKTANPVKIVVYRWSAGQETYYAIKSPSVAPTLNDTTADSITITDALADASILGNPILYTTGGVLEDTGAPASNIITLFDNRLWLVDAEDTNLLWYSKQVIEATPVEMSDLLTIYTAPTTSVQGSTGPTRALAPMDDKLIIFKADAIYYINGQGPDNTGANSSYSNVTFITATVGSSNQQSIVFIPSGLMFQSDKGIWLLGRDLSTKYIGDAVQSLTATATVLSAVSVPGTNQVRFTMDSGITLMYDYYYNQWCTFTNIPSISSTLVNSLHTFLTASGTVFRETPGLYLDGTTPVLMSFTTSWLNLAGVQGYERFYHMFLLGNYVSPFKLNVQFAYDYNANPQDSCIITPSTPSPLYGNEALWGSGKAWGGGNAGPFEARIFPQQQKVESFQITVKEIYDPQYGTAAGAGLTLSGLNLIVGLKKGYRVQSAGRSFGSGST